MHILSGKTLTSIRNCARLYDREANKILHEFEIKYIHAILMNYVSDNEGISYRELVEIAFRDAVTIHKDMKLLQAYGLLTRKPNRNDKRQTYVYLTTHGKTLLSKINKKLNDFNTKILSELSKPDLKTLNNAVSIIMDKVESHL